jgi:pyruvate kinase
MPTQTTTPQINSTLTELEELRGSCIALEREFEPSIDQAHPQSQRSVRNLLHYLALRQHDLRDLQSRLSALGVSSLGRNESSALAGLEAVIAVLESLAGEKRETLTIGVDLESGPAILAEQAKHLLGPIPKGRSVRVMVTMPSEAAQSYELVQGLVEVGMDVMRVNCAHDSEREWELMIAHMRRANQELGRHCKVLMDLAGPKLRTGPIHRGDHVVRWKVEKDARGRVVAPALIVLAGKHAGSEILSAAETVLPVPAALLRSARIGDKVQIKDSRKKTRELTVTHPSDHACVCTCPQSAYVLSRAEWSIERDGERIATGRVGELPFVEEPIRLHPRDLLVLTREEQSKPLKRHGDIPHISCTLPEAFSTARADQPIFFDDGKIEGRLREVHPDHMLVEILHTAARGAELGSAKGINLPETDLGVDAMTEKDKRDLDFVAKHADIVGLSFVRRPEDVLELQRELAARRNSGLGIILKIESRQGFEQFP